MMELTPISSFHQFETRKKSLTFSNGFLSNICFLWVKSLLKNHEKLVEFELESSLPDDLALKSQPISINSIKFSIYSLINANKLLYFTCFILEFFSLIFEYSSPVFIQLLISYLEEDSSNSNSGIWLFACFFVVNYCYPLVDVHRRFTTVRLELKIRNLLFGEIFQKSLKSSSLPEGTCVNILSVDTQNVTAFLNNLPYNFFIPFQIIFSLVLIYNQVGNAVWLAVGVIILAFVTNGVFSSTCSKANDRLMQVRDLRLSQSSQFLTEIRPIKANAWQSRFVEKILKTRKKELKHRRFINMLTSLNVFYFLALPSIMAVAVISWYTFVMSQDLTAEKIFVTLSTLFLIQHPVMYIPYFFMELMKALVSKKRIEDLINSSDIQPLQTKPYIEFINATLAYDQKIVLKNIQLVIKPQEFIAVVGPVGSGKSSLLLAIMGDLRVLSGKVNSSANLAYCAGLDSWLINASLRENILMGLKYDEDWFLQVVQSCCLENDISQLPAGDLTEIGERGINLSGGQKARVCLARAVYANRDVYLLDDPLSSVDQEVASRVFEKCFLGLLKQKTRVLVTHRRDGLNRVGRILHLKSGEIFKETQVFQDSEDSQNFEGQDDLSYEEELDESKPGAEGDESMTDDGKKDEDDEENELIQDEDMEKGVVNQEVYRSYARYAGGATWIGLAVLCIAGWMIVDTLADISLKYWADEDSSNYFSFYISMKGSGVVMILLATIVIHCIMSIKASESSHSDLIKSLSQAPINLFYDVTPAGRVLNRLSHDLEVIDTELPHDINSVLVLFAIILSTGIVCIIYFPLVTLLIPIITYPATFIIKAYIKAARELTRLESVSMSPVLSNFKETLQGSKYIRTFQLQALFTEKNIFLVNKNSVFQYFLQASQQWARLYLGILSASFSSSIFLLSIWLKDEISIGSVGLCLSYAFFLPDLLSELLMSLTELENKMVAVERVKSMSAVIQENNKGLKSIENWPGRGEIQFYKVFMRYRPNTELVLKGASFTIPPNQHVGIIGRTGSGKSSLFNALLRIVEIESGVILIDGVNIARINLESLRKMFTLVPQDPLVFDGTIRENIDPFQSFEDNQIQNALKMTGLKFDLLFEVRESGKNISVGERQMISLCRAFVSCSKFVLFDEATAGIDVETDERIQAALASLFKTSTVLTIAHRLSTIEKFDLIFEVQDGKVELKQSKVEQKSSFFE